MTDQSSLLDDVDQNTRVLVPTNRYNLTAMFTLGLICSSSGLPKYYPDLLERVPGRVPVLLAPGLPVDLTPDLMAGEETAYPVLIELDPEKPVIGSSYLVGSVGPTTAVHVVPGVFPTTAVRAVHFRTDTEMLEYQARAFDNFDPASLNTAISPELFEVSLDDAQALRDSLASVDEDGGPTSSDIDEVDGIVGALALVAAMGPATPTSTGFTGGLLDTFLTKESRVDAGWLSERLGALVADGDDAEPDSVLLQVLIDAASEERPTTSTAGSFLDRVRKHPLLEALPETQRLVVDRNLDHVLAIIRADRALQPFKPGGLISAKALLLVLLRPEPRATSTWVSDPLGPGESALIVSLAVAGLASRYRGLPVELRGGADFSEAISNAMADRLNRRAGNDLPQHTQGRNLRVVTEQDDGGTITYRYKLGRRFVLDRRAQVVDDHETETPPEGSDGRPAPDLESEEGRKAALELAERMEWLDCIRITIRAVQAEIRAVDAGLEIEIDGTADFSRGLDVDRFLEHANRSDLDLALPEAVDS